MVAMGGPFLWSLDDEGTGCDAAAKKFGNVRVREGGGDYRRNVGCRRRSRASDQQMVEGCIDQLSVDAGSGAREQCPFFNPIGT
jgi:hypothetical protein